MAGLSQLRETMKLKVLTLLSAFFFATLAVTAASAQTSPDKFIEDLSGKVIGQVKADKDIQAGDLKRVSELVDSTLMPHVNFERMTALAVGRAWREATPEQKKQLMTEFRMLWSRTAVKALA